ncbi:MAG: MATE family efflux transporter [Firmicutes bacterium]|nr:MATE family efflux transporter [Bacillota bacterium]
MQSDQFQIDVVQDNDKDNGSAYIGEDNITTLLYRFSLPAIVGMLVMATYNVVDTFFVARLGSEAIAALSVAFPLQMLMGAIGVGSGIGAASLVSRSLGAKDREEAENALGQVITLAMVFGFIIAVAGFIYMRPLLVFLGTNPDIIALTEEYLLVITSGSALFFLIMILNNVVRAEGNPMLSMNMMIVSAVANIILDPIFIFTLGMGIRGAAIATMLAKIVGIVMMLHYFISGKSVLRFRFSSLKLRWKTILNIYKIGLPAMILQFSNNISLIITNVVLAGYGYIPVAVMGLVFRLQLFAIMPAIGIAQGLLPIIGYNFGAQKMDRVKEAFLKSAVAGTVLITLAGAIFFLSPSFFLGIFSQEAELLAIGNHAVRIMVIMFPCIAAQIVSGSFFQAIGKGIPSLVLSLLREVIVFIPFLFLLSDHFGLTGVWAARPVSDLVAFLLTFILIFHEFKKQGMPLNLRLLHSYK